MDTAADNRGATRAAVIAVACLALLIVLLVVFLETGPHLDREPGLRGAMASWRFELDAVLQIMLFVSVIAIAVLGMSLLLPRTEAQSAGFRRKTLGFLIVLTFISGIFYFYGYRGFARPQFINSWDLFHYYVGPKYFDELNYTGLYRAAVVAARQEKLELDESEAIRDLRNYGFLRSWFVRESGEHLSRFTPGRWEEFKRDVALIHGNRGPKYFGELLTDHGYNGTPVWNFFGSNLANLIPASFRNLTLLALLDILLLLGSFVVVIRCYGWRPGLLFAVFSCVMFTSRFIQVGGTFLRHAWMAALVVGIAMVHRKRHLAGGVLLAISSLFNIFPVLFVAGIAIKAVVETIRRRRLAVEHRRFALGFVLTAVVLLGLSLTASRGLEGYRSFFHQMGQHTEKLTISRVGFQYLFLFHGEVTERDETVPYVVKLQELKAKRPWVLGFAGLGLLLCAAVACRLDDARAAILFGVTAIFLVFSLVQYYWAIMALLMLLWHGEGRQDVWGALAMFVMNALILIGWEATHFEEFVNNSLTSALLLVYLGGAVAYFACTTRMEPHAA